MKASGTREFSALVGAVYEAGLDVTGSLWPAVLERLSPVAADGGPVMLAFERRRFDYAHTYGVSEDPAMIATYQAHFARIDPVLEPLLAMATPGVLFRTERVMSEQALRRTEFYADWLRPRGIATGTGTVLVRQGSARATLMTARFRHLPDPVAADFQLLTLLLPHLAAAVTTTLRLVGAGAARDALAGALDRSSDGIFLVDRDGRVRAANRVAESLVAAADGLAVAPARGGVRGVLRAATPAATAALARLVRAAAAVAESRAIVGPGYAAALALPRSSGRPPLCAFVAPLASGEAGQAVWLEALVLDAGRAVAVVIVTDPTAVEPRVDAVALAGLRGAFGLSHAEAAVAIALSRGIGLAAVADARHVTLATVRTQAQAAYRKTSTRGQAALARLVERLGRAGA